MIIKIDIDDVTIERIKKGINNEESKKNDELKIEIVSSTNKKDRKSIFFNPELWNRFENFCKKNKQFKKHDVINQALYELLERVDK